jgi:hypothetical protein
MPQNPQNPVIASFPVPPPVFNFPFTGANGMLTPAAMEFLQLMWAAIQGGGGIIDIIVQEQPGGATIGPGGAESIAQDAADQALMRAYTTPRQAPDHTFGVLFSKGDISTMTLGATMGRAPSPVNWRIPITAGRSWGVVGTAPGADTVFTLAIDGNPVGTATWHTGQTTAVCAMTANTYLRGQVDYLDLVAPTNLNGMKGPFGLAVVGDRSW